MISAALASAKHPACPAVETDMRVTIGDIEIGPNGELMKALRNVVHDVTQGPGPSNDLVGSDGALATKLKDAAKDLTQGPGPTNDVVGRQGWLRSRLGF